MVQIESKGECEGRMVAAEGGIPCIRGSPKKGEREDDGWVGGLNGLLKFNYPFGEEE